MKILIVSDAWEPQVNGVVRTLKMTRRQLYLKGHETELVSPLGFRSFACPTYPEISLAITSPLALERQIDRFAPDCLHIATEGPLGWMARRIALRRGWPFTTAYHSRFPEYIHARFRVPPAWTYGLLRRFHNAARATLVPTPAIVADLRARGFHSTRLWSRGVDFETFDPAGERETSVARPVFLYVGRIAIEKQVDAFLKLDLPGEKWVAGEGPARRQLQARYPQARWFGVLSGTELACLYRSADVMVFPSRTDTFGLVMVEAMACGTPVAAFPVAGPLDVIADSGAGVMHDDLRVACLQALRLPRDRARKRAEQFSWSAATDQLLSALQPIPHD
jgi:glycosyltransferase involved in cell wall biosynthesis